MVKILKEYKKFTKRRIKNRKIIILLVNSAILLVSGLFTISFWLSENQGLVIPLESKTGVFASSETNIYIKGENFGLLSFDINGNNVYILYIYAGSNDPPIFTMDGLTALVERTFDPAELEQIINNLPQTTIYKIYIVQSNMPYPPYEYENVSYTIETYRILNPIFYYGGLPLGIGLIISSNIMITEFFIQYARKRTVKMGTENLTELSSLLTTLISIIPKNLS